MPKPIAMTQSELRQWKKTGVWPDEAGGASKLTKSGRYVQPQPKRGEMNKTENRYAAELESRRVLGEIVAWRFEPLKLRLAKRTYYEPDFLVVLPSGRLEFHEVKGFWRDDARVKIKVAADQFAMFKFLAVSWKGGQWKCETF